MFADIKEIRTGAALALQSKLRQAATAVKQPQLGSANLSRPPQVYLSPSYAVPLNSSGHCPPSTILPATGRTGAHADFTNIGSGTVTDILSTARPLRYVLLCVNARRSRTLEHIDVSTVDTDEALFDSLRERYSLARESHKWQLPLLSWIAPLWKYILGHRVDLSILKPKSADYVRV